MATLRRVTAVTYGGTNFPRLIRTTIRRRLIVTETHKPFSAERKQADRAARSDRAKSCARWADRPELLR